jgi:hypothetical protein
MRVYFPSLALCLVAFLPWSRWLAAPWARLVARYRRGGRPAAPRAVAPVGVVAAIVLVGEAVAGARGAVRGWPFACYPTFASPVPDEMPALEAELVDGEGRSRPLAPPAMSGLDAQRRIGLGWALALDPRPDRLERWGRLAAGPALDGARAIRVYRVVRSTDPAERGAPPRRRELLHVFGP